MEENTRTRRARRKRSEPCVPRDNGSWLHGKEDSLAVRRTRPATSAKEKGIEEKEKVEEKEELEAMAHGMMGSRKRRPSGCA